MVELMPLRDSIQGLVDALSMQLKLEMEVVDARLNRIGATGNLRRLTGTRQERGFINRYVLETGKPMLIANPGREHLCSPCDLRHSCAYRAGLACPIVRQGHVVGVFSLMGLDDGDRAMLQQGGDHLLSLIGRLINGLVAGQIFGERDPNHQQNLAAVSSALQLSRQGRRRACSVAPAPAPAPADPFAGIVGASAPLQRVVAKARRVATRGDLVLLMGETGTGKELFARAIHGASPAGQGPLVAVNCSAIPESLLESELFGYEEGAFTGARRGGKAGKFELADGGTLFLDEVSELPLSLQPKLLRVLERRTIERVGGTGQRAVNIQIIAACNCDLAERVRQGSFRADLYYRLKGLPIRLPPLRERREDIGLLADHFLAAEAARSGQAARRLSFTAQEALLAYDWPGNVRELKNAVEYAALMAEGDEITLTSLPDELQDGRSSTGSGSLRERVQAYERQLLAAALESEGGHVEGKRRVADSMGVSLPTLYRRLKELGLSD